MGKKYCPIESCLIVALKLQIKSSHHDTKGFSALFVPQAGRHCTLRVPHGKSGHDDPKNGEFIQKLSEEWEGGVKVGRAGADDDEEGPDDVNPVTHTWGVRLLKILIRLIDKLPTQIRILNTAFLDKNVYEMWQHSYAEPS